MTKGPISVIATALDGASIGYHLSYDDLTEEEKKVIEQVTDVLHKRITTIVRPRVTFEFAIAKDYKNNG